MQARRGFHLKLRFLIGLLLVVSAFAQEPRGIIQPQETISKASTSMTVMVSDELAPMIYPNPRPLLPLGEIARKVRATHVLAPKAVKIANDETEVLMVEANQEKRGGQ